MEYCGYRDAFEADGTQLNRQKRGTLKTEWEKHTILVVTGAMDEREMLATLYFEHPF